MAGIRDFIPVEEVELRRITSFHRSFHDMPPLHLRVHHYLGEHRLTAYYVVSKGMLQVDVWCIVLRSQGVESEACLGFGIQSTMVGPWVRGP